MKPEERLVLSMWQHYGRSEKQYAFIEWDAEELGITNVTEMISNFCTRFIAQTRKAESKDNCRIEVECFSKDTGEIFRTDSDEITGHLLEKYILALIVPEGMYV